MPTGLAGENVMHHFFCIIAPLILLHRQQEMRATRERSCLPSSKPKCQATADIVTSEKPKIYRLVARHKATEIAKK